MLSMMTMMMKIMTTMRIIILIQMMTKFQIWQGSKGDDNDYDDGFDDDNDYGDDFDKVGKCSQMFGQVHVSQFWSRIQIRLFWICQQAMHKMKGKS